MGAYDCCFLYAYGKPSQNTFLTFLWGAFYSVIPHNERISASCASLLVAQGFALKDIQEWLGHSDIQTTANIYAHLDDERKKNISKKMTNSLHF